VLEATGLRVEEAARTIQESSAGGRKPGVRRLVERSQLRAAELESCNDVDHLPHCHEDKGGHLA
jgi:hypothetical protein